MLNMLFNTLLKITPHNTRKRSSDIHDGICGGLPIQFLTPPDRAQLEWRYLKTEFREAFCEIRISSLCCGVLLELSSVWRLCIFSKFCKGVY